MTGSVNSRQVLTMDESAASVSFGKKNGCYVNRLAWVLLLVLFISALVATGLLVYYYAPNMRQTAARSHSSETHANTYDVMTKAPPMTTGPIIVTTTSMPPSEKVMDVRLPRSLKPIKYVVKLRPLLSGNFTIFGNVEVEMEAMYDTNNITLHIAAITTKNETVKVTPAEDRSGPGIRIIKQVYDNQREFYIAHLGQTLQKGRKYVISMDYIGYLNDELRGFYRASYKDLAGTDKFMATTQFQPTDARRAFPCFDEPAMKAKFEIYLGRELSKTSLTNMPKTETMPIEGMDGWVWDHYNTSVPMSTYLVAFVVSDFKMMETKTKNNVGYRVWARDVAIDQAKYALETGPPVLTFFEDYFNISYPLPKQDMIAITDFSAGAMENWGLITYRETAMLYDPAVSSASNKQRIAIVIAHELAHQWFGNLVTPSWWTDLWLNEGFASYMEYIGTDHAEPHWQIMEQFLTIDLQSVFTLDCLESSHPISIPVNHPDEINEIFDKISYSKGSSVIRMMSHFLTEATFRRGLTNYLNKLAYDSAEQDDLWMYLTNAAHGDGTLPRDVTVKMIMDTWTLQMGYPVIKVTRSSDGRQAEVSQERFLMVKNGQLTDSHVYRWWVPLTYTSQNNPDFDSTQPEQWMKDTEAEMIVTSLPAKDQWVIFNIQETGYYRVNYDEDNWNLLIRQLNEDHTVIHVNNRAQLIDDAFNLARAGQLSYRTALGVIGYLAKEKSYVPVTSALSALDYLVSMFKRHGGYGALKSYILTLVIPLYNSVGFQDQLSDPHLDQFKRVKALSWACSLGHQECIDQATNLFKRWMANPQDKGIISANLKDVVYCNAIAAGGEEEWNFGWRQYLASNVATEKLKLIYALGCTKKLWMLSRYLDMAFTKDKNIRKQDAGYVFRAVAGNDLGRDMAWSYLRNNWLHILNYYGSGIFTLPRLIGAVTTELNTEEYLKEVREFKSVHGATLGTAKRAVDQGEERTVNNVAWANANSEVIVQWLEDNGYSSNVPSL